MASRAPVSRASAGANVVDSSGWLEYMDDGPNAEVFESAILAVERLLVPTISLYEVFKKVLRDTGEEEALALVGQMRQATVIDLDATLALEAGKLGVDLQLPLADSIILATARAHQATLWTQDEHFNGIPGVQYIPKR
ncbi:MAG TPA: type II toxin-antitoxin system VapC family toxin [Gemmatimonadaceae bacterium]|nr:type II toxin-antitoxin system VapC family toxin [Gemmatimonadaceae bacterium]